MSRPKWRAMDLEAKIAVKDRVMLNAYDERCGQVGYIESMDGDSCCVRFPNGRFKMCGRCNLFFYPDDDEYERRKKEARKLYRRLQKERGRV
jgi:predicted PP-loop superfamily ATPase